MYYTFSFEKVIVCHSERSKESRQPLLPPSLNGRGDIKALTPMQSILL